MKCSILSALVIFAVSNYSFAKSHNVYADVQVTDIKPTSGFIWERENKSAPQYPMELARSGIAGCAVMSFDISESGKAENIEVVKSVPQKSLGKYSSQILKKWNWVPTAATNVMTSERRTIRLDFCIGNESTEQSQNACKQQTQLVCG
ncbi:energy transducer TonB [Shewanella sp. SM20]|uniref:energy transducer TonB n=1 Tax=Shewanella TaxID=22 RepID=UPI0021D84BFC|nr:energy transducer TonB [Shewanella sp. SM20]MCU8091666.1 energy transducer TonB [Shewanella sp. SM20]